MIKSILFRIRKEHDLRLIVFNRDSTFGIVIQTVGRLFFPYSRIRTKTPHWNKKFSCLRTWAGRNLGVLHFSSWNGGSGIFWAFRDWPLAARPACRPAVVASWDHSPPANGCTAKHSSSQILHPWRASGAACPHPEGASRPMIAIRQCVYL